MAQILIAELVTSVTASSLYEMKYYFQLYIHACFYFWEQKNFTVLIIVSCLTYSNLAPCQMQNLVVRGKKAASHVSKIIKFIDRKPNLFSPQCIKTKELYSINITLSLLHYVNHNNKLI